MTVTTVATATFIKDATLMLRDDLIANITDPISAKRSGTDKFVMTSYPERNVKYPIITVRRKSLPTGLALGAQATVHWTDMEMEVRVWARNVAEKDKLLQEVINRFRSARLTTYAAGGMFDFEIRSIVDVDEPGEAGINSGIMTVGFRFVLGS